MASASEGNDTVKVWDLRKMRAVHTITFDDEDTVFVNVLKFDYSGAFLVVGGIDVRVYSLKPFECLVVVNEAEEVGDLAFGRLNASELIVSSSGLPLRLYSQ
jgi:pre-mRNA-processing factor 19